MRFQTPGQYKTVDAFREHLRTIDGSFDCDTTLEGADGPLGKPLDVLGRTLENRFVIHPMEGWDGTRDGLPTEHTLRRWRNFGRSGAGLLWGGEAFAVRADGRANPGQLFQNDDADVPGSLAALLEAARTGRREVGGSPDDLVIGLQLTHSGRFARPAGAPEPRIAAHIPALDEKFGIVAEDAPLQDDELEAIAERFVSAGVLAQNAGFDFVDVKACHGYLLHELLGAQARPGPYGGSFENRTRFFRDVVGAIQTRCPGLGIAVRVSIADVFPHTPDEAGDGEPRGWRDHVPYRHGFGIDASDPRHFDLAEPFRFLELTRDLGIRLVNLTLGSPYYCPHLQRPAAYPPSDGYRPPRDPLAEVFEHLRVTRACKARFPDLAFVGSGYSYLQEWLPNVAQFEVGHGHVDLVGIGRMVLSYPELPLDALAGRAMDRKRICRTFSDCTTGPRKGLISGCYPLDPYYRRLPEAAELKAEKRALRS